jgi:5-methylcytosine-specific restriction endonuclease McrA
MNTPKHLRHIVFERDSYTCVLCQQAATDAHHVRPRSLGGRNTPHNLVSLCRAHHCYIHGERLIGEALSREESRQALIEYLHDYYAEEIERGEFCGF